jgi:BirA family biotin operon repressor/biotin-[acetyl-CoA-carboxylase] ligase
VLDRVDSTNAEAGRRAAAGGGPAWILATEQTGGRGRRGRAWASPPGNFHATLLAFPDLPAGRAALLSFAAAVALAEALDALTGAGAALTLKWPNDVLLGGGKVAGILLEAEGQGDRLTHLAVGIGANLAAAPAVAEVEPGALLPVTVAAATGRRIAPEALLDTLAPAFAVWQARLTAEGFAPLRTAWLARAARLGQPIAARTAQTTRHGRFETIDETGALILGTATGPVAIPAAEVFFP